MDANAIKKFVEKYKGLEVNPKSDPLTTWENNLTDLMIPPRVLNRYCNLLSSLNKVLLCLVAVSLLVLVGLIVNFVFFTDLEMFIFIDGTDLSCVLDPQIGVITQNDQRQ